VRKIEGYRWRFCVPDLDRLERATAVQNVPLLFGEWSISTNIIATDKFLKKWADAQKLSLPDVGS